MSKYLIRQEPHQVPPYNATFMAQGLLAQLAHLLPPVVEPDDLLDKRLVRTFVQLIAVILTFRDRANGVLLSESGGYLLPGVHPFCCASAHERAPPAAWGQFVQPTALRASHVRTCQ